MNWAIKIISKTLMTKISHISWGGYDKGFYGSLMNDNERRKVKNSLRFIEKILCINNKTYNKNNIIK